LGGPRGICQGAAGDESSAPDSERAIWEDPAVKSWLAQSQQASVDLPFRGWKNISIRDDELHSKFDFLLFQEWARSRRPMATKTLQMPYCGKISQQSLSTLIEEDSPFLSREKLIPQIRWWQIFMVTVCYFDL
jgi:hypothetical protein